MNIRQYTKEDHSSIINLLLLNSPKFFAPIEKEDLKNYLEKNSEHYKVLTIQNKIIATGGFNFISTENLVRISWDIVHPQHQGRGLGTTLLNYRMNLIRKLYGNINIVVRTSQMAFRFYAKHGFKTISVHKNYWADGFDMYYVELTLI